MSESREIDCTVGQSPEDTDVALLLEEWRMGRRMFEAAEAIQSQAILGSIGAMAVGIAAYVQFAHDAHLPAALLLLAYFSSMVGNFVAAQNDRMFDYADYEEKFVRPAIRKRVKSDDVLLWEGFWRERRMGAKGVADGSFWQCWSRRLGGVFPHAFFMIPSVVALGVFISQWKEWWGSLPCVLAAVLAALVTLYYVAMVYAVGSRFQEQSRRVPLDLERRREREKHEREEQQRVADLADAKKARGDRRPKAGAAD